MKKLISLLLAVIMIVSCFSGCKETKNEDGSVTLRVVATSYLEFDADWLDKLMELVYPEENINLEFEYLPVDGKTDIAEYEATLTRLRSEIMAGKGPDVFILPTWTTDVMRDESGNILPKREPLFIDVEETMRNRVFYRLDELMENSEMFNLEDQESVIMEAGRLSDGQYVLPLLYSLNFGLVEKSRMKDPEVSFNTLEEFVNCGDEKLVLSSEYSLHNCFPNYADYDKGELMITPEQIADTFKMVGEMDPVSDYIYYESSIGGGYFDEEALYAWKNSHGAAYPLCVPNTEGGLTAEILVYTAINANTEHPEEAFKLLQIFYSDEFQTNRGFEVEGYNYRFCGGWCPKGWQFSPNFNGIATGRKAYTDDVLYDRAALDEIVNRITNVRFTSEMDSMICDAWYRLKFERYGETLTEEDYLAVAQELYKQMQMSLAE